MNYFRQEVDAELFHDRVPDSVFQLHNVVAGCGAIGVYQD